MNLMLVARSVFHDTSRTPTYRGSTSIEKRVPSYLYPSLRASSRLFWLLWHTHHHNHRSISRVIVIDKEIKENWLLANISSNTAADGRVETSNLLSYGNRITLIKAILSSMTLRYMKAFKLLVEVIKHIDRMTRNILWKGNEACKVSIASSTEK